MWDAFALHEIILDAQGNPADYRFLAINPAFERMTGLSAQEVVGRTVKQVQPSLGPHWIEKYGHVAMTGEPLRFENREAALKRLFDVQAYRPEPGQVACIFRDITERTSRENENRRSGDEYRAIFEGVPQGIFRTSREGRVLAANPALVEMLGYHHEIELLGESAERFWADPDERLECLRIIQGEGFLRKHECRLKRKDGTVLWVSLSARKFNGPDGRAGYLIGFIEDVTARKGAEQNLRASEYKFKMAFMTGTDACTISGFEDGVVLEVNCHFTELFGYSREEACGRTSRELGWYADDDRHRLLAALNSEGQVEELPFQLRRKNGEIRSVLISANLMEIDGRKLIFLKVRDVTAQKMLEAEKTRLEDQFRQAQKLESIGRMAGGIAHDFNNQLTVINGYADLLFRGSKPGDPLREWIAEVVKAGERSASLVRQLLTFSRKQPLDLQPVSWHDLIGKMESMLQRLLGEEIELVVETESALWPILADPGQLQQVVMNLAVNARDAMPRGGALAILAANVELREDDMPPDHPTLAPGQYVVLRVRDTGAGIPKEIQERIFEPFFTTKPEGEGTGLGLSTVYGIVRQLEGSIAVRSQLGRGATFEIYLPQLRDEAPIQFHTPPSPVRRIANVETILVVEDQTPVRQLAVLTLREHGYEVLEAASGEDALGIASSHTGPLHLILADLVMPRMTGVELVDRLKSERPEIKVLFMSGYSADSLAHRGLMKPDWAFIPKPFPPDALAVRIRELLGHPRSPGSVLVADDDESVRGFFQQVLTTAGYDVAVAPDGSVALLKLSERPYDLLLTDLVMPEKEGLEVIMTLRNERPNLKVIAVSGAFGGTFLEAAKALGAHAVLLKPVSPDSLLETVQQTLEGGG
jgi:hypothetical protein